ncbi:hypothetical protein BSPLISOX_521 [uncultured Gammaproteobacteria bacterium]|nr:hypothetical protein [uncultured Gammaproteobacteria bacterium]SHN93193.1 hypothetical protein BCLUESOX_408 [bacterium endosymbiont of Bathymodiolus sp. 5 South]VVH58902.1 hypothetical protein BSPCLSOX_445 [uncultured Gammaproteobacteria bacterium]VVH62023.1 hypothetical protein BSPWISOX_5 [uncultured Gammaproteobacteria bacterium]VVH65323.1 hypothetical protein BSPLISOX_521 [uncultured Gammaproteobacteria bacterium]
MSTPLGALKRTYGLAKIASKVNLKAIAYNLRPLHKYE